MRVSEAKKLKSRFDQLTKTIHRLLNEQMQERRKGGFPLPNAKRFIALHRANKERLKLISGVFHKVIAETLDKKRST